MRNRNRAAAAAATAGMAASLLLMTVPASAATVVAGYSMNESSGGTMRDSTGRHPGTIGSEVVLTGKTYKFPRVADRHEYRPQHIVSVPDSPALDPGTSTWSATTRFRTVQGNGNIVQKGQSTGGYFKLEVHRGSVTCLFRGSAGSKAVGTGSRKLNDGLWHTVTCRRSGSTVSITVDGKTRAVTGATGNIANNYPLTIGGKSACKATTVTCDYWFGEMDYLRISTG